MEWIKAKVKKINIWNNNLFSIILKAKINNFIAGQFVRLTTLKSKNNIRRAYSYVNSPNNKNLEFYIVKINSGNLSNELYNLKKNDYILITKESFGFFTLNEIPKCKNLWMFSTGTAIGPYLSILQYKKNLTFFKNLILVHAVKFIKDLSYLILINNLKKKYKNKLKVILIVSREKSNISILGRIPKLISNGVIEKKTNIKINKKNDHIMLCGNPNMIIETQKLLKKKYNMKKNLRRIPGNITIENYWKNIIIKENL
ncbi:Ferredoxin--NADP reductase [Candidatus Annandia adelgestsuga]|uniref:Flavodoxin/ferredoxin--NADP reductase n=1 Tax=Candidatus Annandia adelgestsuga TaxID=1302411 RepID=A0A3S9J843_9ENTR|nr:FAD-binding oxidoreductase [Candidatus Annandia adelgestsuga]AZP36419.1 Ferredoxin--NADP reductase [Candidatus Annandia adelgestsuga]